MLCYAIYLLQKSPLTENVLLCDTLCLSYTCLIFLHNLSIVQAKHLRECALPFCEMESRGKMKTLALEKKAEYKVGDHVLGRRANNPMKRFTPCVVTDVHQMRLPNPGGGWQAENGVPLALMVKAVTLGAVPATVYSYDVKYEDEYEEKGLDGARLRRAIERIDGK